MSIGQQFLRAAIENGSRTTFRQADESLFLEDEKKNYTFVWDFYRTYGHLPSMDACAEKGITLPRASDSPEYYLDRLNNRALYNILRTHVQALNNPIRDRDVDEAVRILRETLYSANRVKASDEVVSLTDMVDSVMSAYREAHILGGTQGITLGWPYLDAITNGAEAGDVITLVARPNIGKSWLAVHVAHQAWLSGASVLFVTMEMTAEQITRRFMGLQGRFNPDYLRRGQLSYYGEEVAHQVVTDVKTGAPFHLISGSFERSTVAVDAAAQQFSPDMIFIDASYLMSPAGAKGRKANHELLSEVGKEVKAIALNRKRPIFQTVQFNREVKKSKTPDLVHIGGSDSVGQISTIVLSVEPGDSPNEIAKRKITMLKNREGPKTAFTIDFKFSPPNFAFDKILEAETTEAGIQQKQARVGKEDDGWGA